MRNRLKTSAAALSLALLAALTAASPRPAVASGVAMRSRVFGAANVDQVTGAVRSDRVILSWFGVTNFAAAIGGHVVLLDAWVPRGEYSGYVPTSPGELATLDPTYVFLGHGHFDHAADAAEIVGASGATLVGSPEHCDQVRASTPTAACVAVGTRGGAPGQVSELSFLSGVGITAVKHVHSAAEPHDPTDLHAPTLPPPSADAIVQHPPSPQDTQHLIRHLGDAENGTILYQFRVGGFSLTWHDSSGPMKERAPQVFDVFKNLPATDVQVGAIMGFNQISNGLRDPRMYIEAIRPRVFVPSHHDNWAPGVSTRGENYRPYIEEELAKIPADRRPTLQFIADPGDYFNPAALTFDINDPRWL